MKILVILGHPDNESYNAALAGAYARGAKGSGHEVREIRVADLKFDPILHKGYREVQELEPDLKKCQEDIRWAEHVVFVFPTWWASFPALFKGFIDRVILPGFAFKFRRNSPVPERLLRGRSARLITTMGGPSLVYTLLWFSPGVNALKKAFLALCGVSPVRVTRIDRMSSASPQRLTAWIKKVEELGQRGG